MEEETVVTTEVAVEEVKEEVQETAEVKEEVAETKPPEPKKKTAQERIDEITRARREAEREKEYWKQVALAKKEEPPTKQEPSIYPPRPKVEQFETTQEYEDALLEWHENKKEVQTRANRQRVEQESAVKTFNERAEKLRTEHEDFDEVIEAEVFSPVMRAALLKSETGPEIAYFLGKPENWKEADRIRNLPLEMQPYELGKLETKLLVAKQTKKITDAPPPIKPVGMTGGSEKDPSKMTIEEWMAWDKQKEEDKRKSQYGG